MKKFFQTMICVLLLLSMILPAEAASTKASSVTLSSIEGTVTVKNASGKAVTAREGMSLYSGYSVSTSGKSYVYLTLDSSKVVKLSEYTSLTLKKSGKKIELALENGELFFNVTMPLASDESLDIRTSTMVTGIRGTAGSVSNELVASDTRIEYVQIFTGKVQVAAYPSAKKLTGNDSGKRILAVSDAQMLTSQQISTDKSSNLTLTDLTESDISGNSAMAIANDPSLQNTIDAGGKLSSKIIVGGAEDRLKKDQATHVGMDTPITKIVADPVFPPVTNGEETLVPDWATVTTLEELIDALSSEDISKVHLTGQITASTNDLSAYSAQYQEQNPNEQPDAIGVIADTTALIVPEGKELTLESGSRLSQDQDASLNLGINGNVIVDSGAALEAHTEIQGGTLQNNGTIGGELSNYGGTMAILSGKISADIGNSDGGALTISGGTVSGMIFNSEDCTLTISGGTVDAYISNIFGNVSVTGGTLQLGEYSDGTVLYGDGGSVNITGGTFDAEELEAIYVSDCAINISNATITGDVNVLGSNLEISGNGTMINGCVTVHSAQTEAAVLGGSLTVNNGSFVCVKEDGGDEAYYAFEADTIQLNGGTVTGPVYAYDSININGATINGRVLCPNGSLAMSSGRIVYEESNGYAIYAGALDLTGGTVDAIIEYAPEYQGTIQCFFAGGNYNADLGMVKIMTDGRNLTGLGFYPAALGSNNMYRVNLGESTVVNFD